MLQLKQNLRLVASLALVAGAWFADAQEDRVAPEVDARTEYGAIAEGFNQSSNPYMGYAQVPKLRADLAAAGEDLETLEPVAFDLSWHYLRVGMVDEAVALIEAVMPRLDASSEFGNLMPKWHLRRGLAYLRKSELENCIINHNRECCVFPLAGGGLHQERRPAEEARKSLLAYMAAEPEDPKTKWVVNVLSMALGDYPHAVDESYRVSPEHLMSDFDIGAFTNIAPALGVATVDLAGGSVVDDFNNDGFMDIISSSLDVNQSLTYFQSSGDGTFKDVTREAGLADMLGAINLIHADYDNDGYLDLYMLCGAWQLDGGKIRNALLRNRGDGTFEDVTRAAGVAEPAYPSHSAVWGDFNNDGHLDLFVGNEDSSFRENASPFPSNLFMNDGDGTFTDRAEAAGVTVNRYIKGTAAADFDNDGDLDLYVSNIIGPNMLFRNEGDGTFTEVGKSAGVTEPAGATYLPAYVRHAKGIEGLMRNKKGASFPCFFFDYNNDGWLDLLVADFTATLEDLLNYYQGRPHGAQSTCLYRNNGDGTFTDVASDIGLGGPYRTMGAGFGDLDNDGWLDVYLTTGEPDYLSLMPNAMFRNDGGKMFQDVTSSGGFGNLQKGHGVSFADIDNDGHQDVYHQQGGAYPGDKYQNALYHNPGRDANFLYITLRGETSNRSGVGARIKAVIEEDGETRELHRAAGTYTSFGANPMRIELGVGQANRVKHLEVLWPASGERTAYRDIPVNCWIQVTEGTKDFTVRVLERLTFKPNEDPRG